MNKIIITLSLALASINLAHAFSFSPEMNNKIRTMQIDEVIREIETKLYSEMDEMLNAYDVAWKTPRQNGQPGNFPKCLGLVVAKARELKTALENLQTNEKNCGRPNVHQLARIGEVLKTLEQKLQPLEQWMNEIALLTSPL